MQIVLSTPPADGDYFGVGSFPTLGLLYVAASVKSLPAVNVSIVDPYAEGLDADQAAEKILSMSPDLVGVSLNSRNVRRGCNLIRLVKNARPDLITVLGGHHATLFDRLLLTEIPELDLVLRGEAEASFRALCQRLLEGQDIAAIPGLSHRVDGKLVSGELQLIHDIDSLEFPYRKSLDYDGYFTQSGGFVFPRMPKTTTMISSRGCPYKCTFCSKSLPMARIWRPRSAGNVFRELFQLSEEGYQLVFFVDENLTRDLDRLNELCRLILEHKLPRKMRMGFQGSLHDVPEETLNLMQKAGFDSAFVGVESGSQAQLDRFQKPASVRAVAEGIRKAKRAHMIVFASFITGGPGETAEDAEASKEFLKEVGPHIAEPCPLIIDPGSSLWDEMVGTVEPEKLEDSVSRPIYSFATQPDKETIDSRRQDFMIAFSKSWFHWRRISDLLGLVLHNPSMRYVLMAFVKHPLMLLQFLRRGASPPEFVVK